NPPQVPDYETPPAPNLDNPNDPYQAILDHADQVEARGPLTNGGHHLNWDTHPEWYVDPYTQEMTYGTSGDYFDTLKSMAILEAAQAFATGGATAGIRVPGRGKGGGTRGKPANLPDDRSEGSLRVGNKVSFLRETDDKDVAYWVHAAKEEGYRKVHVASGLHGKENGVMTPNARALAEDRGLAKAFAGELDIEVYDMRQPGERQRYEANRKGDRGDEFFIDAWCNSSVCLWEPSGGHLSGR
ncbi:hypothetical protein, partial [Catellatospora sp. NPDC049609]|uniref:hypothetical protein n=1 Tax=Catellatospora sp. NPDC049609 TaxID=3155505 RepID=UPI00341E1D6F